MKRNKFTITLAILLAATMILSSCAPALHNPREHESGAIFKRNPSMLDFSQVDFDPWDISAGGMSQPLESKPWTILIYMNGSDLESKTGEATADIAEMLGSGVEIDKVNVIILTGGTKQWQRREIPSENLALWEVDSGNLVKLADLPKKSMGAAGTLSSFVQYGHEYFPAKRTGLILWDHGGGSIAGFGHDEHFDDELSLLELNYALKRSIKPTNQLEFIGFDACLMATVEVGVVVSDYAKYLVASQDLEPAEGWDYTFLRELSLRPNINGRAIGQYICDYYMNFFSEDDEHDHYLTLSVTETRKLQAVMETLGAFGAQSKSRISQDQEFAKLSEKRRTTKTFGGSSYRDSNSDMVDILDVCEEFRSVFIGQSEKLKTALSGAVVYNTHNAEHDIGGLSVYFIYHGKNQAQQNLDTYSELFMSAGYTNFLFAFAEELRAKQGTLNSVLTAFFSRPTRSRGEGVIENHDFDFSPVLYKEQRGQFHSVGNVCHESTESNFVWLALENYPLVSTKIIDDKSREVHSIQVRHNDKLGEMLVSIIKDSNSENNAPPHAKIMGMRYDNSPMKRKGLLSLKAGDRLELIDESGKSVHSLTIKNKVNLEYIQPVGYVEGLCATDIYGSKYYCKE